MPAGHPDHLAAGEASICAVYPDARNPFAHPELLRDEELEPWTVHRVWLSGHPTADHYVEVTGTIERKLAALRAHVSQTAHLSNLDAMVRGWLRTAAEEVGWGSERLAETFKAVSIP